MTDDFQKGLITGLAMQPLQVTTEHTTPDSATQEAVPFIQAFSQISGILGIFQAVDESTTE